MGTRTLKYENGEKVTPLFSKEEYDQRLSKLRKTMEERKLEVAIFTSMHNVGYFSNFFYCAFGRPYAQVVTPEKNVTIRLVNHSAPIRNQTKVWKTDMGPSQGDRAWSRGF